MKEQREHTKYNQIIDDDTCSTGCGWNQHWPNLEYHPGTCLEVWGKPWKTPVRI